MAWTSDSIGEYGQTLAQQYGLQITSHVRSPEHNAAVGGAKKSDHLTGFGLDLSGDPKQMEALAAWAKANTGEGKLFRWVGWQVKGHYDHVHLSFNGAPPATVTAASPGGAVLADVEPEALTPESTPAEIEVYIRKTYPDWAWLLTNPELRGVLTRPDIDDLDETEIQSLVEATDYWKTHSSDSRAFDALIGTEPQKAGQLVDSVKNLLGDMFAKAGLPTTDEQLGIVAKNALRAGWVSLQGQILDQGKLNDFIGFALRQQPQNLDGGQLPAGAVGADADALGAIAKQYGVPVPRAAVEDWALRVMEGTATRETFTQYVVNLAKAQWLHDPDVINAMDQGVSPAQFFSPHVARIAETLELSPGQIDLFNDPKYASVTQMYDPAAKTRRSMTLGEVGQWARDQEAYANTRVYKQQNADFALKMARTFGGIA